MKKLAIGVDIGGIITRLDRFQSCINASERGELKHLITRRRRKQHVIPPVVASERGRAQTAAVSATAGSWDRDIRRKTKCNYLER